MDKLRKLFISFPMIFGAVNLFAMEQPDQKIKNEFFYCHLELGQTTHNDCCHWCRVSMNKNPKKIQNYKGCLKCSKSFCGRENCSGDPDPFSKKGCLVCLKICCCSYYQCLEDHEHCYTAKRTYERHKKNNVTSKRVRKEYPSIVLQRCSGDTGVNMQLHSMNLARKNMCKSEITSQVPESKIFLGIQVENKIEDILESEIYIAVEVENNIFEGKTRQNSEMNCEVELEEDPEIAYLEAEIFRAYFSGQ